MARVRQRDTGSVVNVPDEKVGQVLATGYYERVDDKAAAKKSAAKSDSK